MPPQEFADTLRPVQPPHPMRLALTFLWLLAPLAVAAWHFGPGQEYLARDRAAGALKVETLDKADEIEAIEAALAALPKEDREAALRLRLAKAVLRLDNRQLAEGTNELTTLWDEVGSDKSVPADVRAGVQAALAQSR